MEEFDTLLAKDAIEKANFPKAVNCFYSALFLFTKKNRKMRMVTNPKPLNRYVKKIHFKMDAMSKVFSLVKQKEWAISLFHIFKKNIQYF